MSKSKDPNSLSNIDEVTTSDILMDWTVDFTQKKLCGSVTLKMKALQDKVKEIILDAKALTVYSVKVTRQGKEEEIVTAFQTNRWSHAAFGHGLVISLSQPLHKEEAFECCVTYETSPTDCTALCWLEKEQTESQTSPFLYSQCQAIHARTMLPCQDAPSVRATFTANVKVSSKEIVVLMSGLPQEGSSSSEVHNKHATFHQPIPIPSYLIAIAAGNITSVDISPRCRVYAEPAMISKAAAEFEDMEKFLITAEEVAGPYEWQRYDVLVLPPSFPYGGMENPNLTFVTPSIVVGDKSGVEVVIHEICHSWSGNLVSIASWSEFFLNEGFTVFLERLVTEKLHGKPAAHFEGINGWSNLQSDVDHFGATNPLTAMRPNLTGIDPDDAFCRVPYEKGYAFLRYLQSLCEEGEEAFHQWLKKYFSTFRLQSITADQMLACFLENVKVKTSSSSSSTDWQKWYTTPGMPLEKPTFDSTAWDESEIMAQQFLQNDENKNFTFPKHWRTSQHVGFLVALQHHFKDTTTDLEKKKKVKEEEEKLKLLSLLLPRLQNAFGYNDSENSEIRSQWYQLCMKMPGYDQHIEKMKGFLSSIGRMKFVRPLYRAWGSQDLPAAQEWFKRHQLRYHGIAQKMLAKDLGL